MVGLKLLICEIIGREAIGNGERLRKNDGKPNPSLKPL